MIFHGDRRKALLAALVFLFLIVTSVVSDGYFLWLCLSKGYLKILWRRIPLFSVEIPLSPETPLWIPFASLSILFAYLLLVRSLRIQVFLKGRRIHHYHLGALSIGVSILLMIPILLGLQDSPLWIAYKRTSLAEVLEGLSFILLLGGALLILTDGKDLLKKL